MKKKIRRSNYKPEIFYSRELSEKLGVEAIVLDFSPLGSHKVFKAEKAVAEAKRKNYDGVVALTYGNYGDALDREARGTSLQVINFVKGLENLIEVKEQNGKYRIKIRMPDAWLEGENLVRYWRRLFRGYSPDRNIKEIRKTQDYRTLKDLIERKAFDLKKFKCVTNLCDWTDENCYRIPEVRYVVKNNNKVIIPQGSAELSLAFQEEGKCLDFWRFLPWKKRADLVFVTSPGNVLAENYVFKGNLAEKSEAPMLDVERPGKAHKKLISLADKKSYFATLPDTYTAAGCTLHNFDVKKDYPKTKASRTSGICDGVVYYAIDNHMDLPLTYRWEHVEGKDIWKKEPVRRTLKFRRGEKVCFVNTGGS